MPQDAFTINFISKELKSLLCGGKISKIAQPEKDLLTFIIYTPKGSVKLEICLSAKYNRICIAKSDAPAPKTAPAFCMLLRKHLQNALITNVACVDGERIAYLDFECTSEFELTEMRLYCEIMGKYSNAVLVKDGIIVGALKTTAIGESTRRVLFTGAKYVLPEPQDKTEQNDEEGISQILALQGDTAKVISERVRGVSYSTALDIAETYGAGVTARQVTGYLAGEKYEPCVVFCEGKELDFKVRSASADKKIYPTLLEAQTEYYEAVLGKVRLEDERRRLTAALSSGIKKLEKRLAVINGKLLDCVGADEVKLKGELITANIYAIQRGMDGFEAVNYYDEKGGKIKIALDKNLSPADNAQRYFKKYQKLKRTLASVSAQKEETQAELDYLNSIKSHILRGECLKDFEETREELQALGLLKSAPEKKKNAQPATFRRYEKDGFKILAGRNNLQNDRLLKSVSPQDIWLHTQNYHSSHVVIVTDGREVPDGVLLAAAEICAYYSDGRGGSKVPVDYTRRSSVKKPPKSNAGFVIYDDYKTILVAPLPHLELALNE